MHKAEQLGADFCEVRLERLSDPEELSAVVRSASKPLIATNRFSDEDGSQNQQSGERNEILVRAVEEGFQFVDLDFETPDLEQTISQIKKKGASLILSYHDYSGTPAPHELVVKLIDFQKYKPDICKIVTTANHVDDNLTILEFLKANHHNSPLVSFAMGAKGVWSRFLAPLYGAQFTYASLSRGQETAPGQTPIDEMRRIYQTLEASS